MKTVPFQLDYRRHGLGMLIRQPLFPGPIQNNCKGLSSQSGCVDSRRRVAQPVTLSYIMPFPRQRTSTLTSHDA